MLSYTTHSSLALSLSGFVCVQVFEREGGIKEVESNNEYRNKYLGNQMDQLSDNVFDPIVLHFGCNLGLHSFGTLKQYKLAKLTPIEAGCGQRPSECGYPAVNASYYDLSFHPISSDKDCKIYKNSKEIKCYNCDSCKAGVAQYMKTEWRVVAIFNVVLFVVLSIIYFVGCCVKQNAARSHSKV
ncbi:hypothetical protein CsSME_00050419 [Camellia sinensis var. sinensis]